MNQAQPKRALPTAFLELLGKRSSLSACVAFAKLVGFRLSLPRGTTLGAPAWEQCQSIGRQGQEMETGS